MRKHVTWLLAAVCCVTLASWAGTASAKRKHYAANAVAPANNAPASNPTTNKNPTDQDLFNKMDTNQDGSLSLAEFKAGKNEKLAKKAEKDFKAWDKDHDGKLTLKEYKAGVEALKSEIAAVKPAKP